MYRQIIIPTTKEHSIELPENLYGKQVEITVKEIKTKSKKPSRAKNAKNYPQVYRMILSGMLFPSTPIFLR